MLNCTRSEIWFLQSTSQDHHYSQNTQYLLSKTWITSDTHGFRKCDSYGLCLLKRIKCSCWREIWRGFKIDSTCTIETPWRCYLLFERRWIESLLLDVDSYEYKRSLSNWKILLKGFVFNLEEKYPNLQLKWSEKINKHPQRTHLLINLICDLCVCNVIYNYYENSKRLVQIVQPKQPKTKPTSIFQPLKSSRLDVW